MPPRVPPPQRLPPDPARGRWRRYAASSCCVILLVHLAGAPLLAGAPAAAAPAPGCQQLAGDAPRDQVALAGWGGTTAWQVFATGARSSPVTPLEHPGLAAALASGAAPLTLRRFARRQPAAQRFAHPEAHLVAHLPQGPPRPRPAA